MYHRDPEHFKALKKQWADKNLKKVSAMKKAHYARQKRFLGKVLRTLRAVKRWLKKRIDLLNFCKI